MITSSMPGLQKLQLNKCRSVHQLDLSSPFIEYFEAARCKTLSSIHLHSMPQLKYCYLHHNHNLQQISIDSNSLTEFAIGVDRNTAKSNVIRPKATVPSRKLVQMTGKTNSKVQSIYIKCAGRDCFSHLALSSMARGFALNLETKNMKDLILDDVNIGSAQYHALIGQGVWSIQIKVRITPRRIVV